MKRFICASLSAIMLFSSTVFADTNVFVGDKLVEYTDQAPVIINDRTYVPIRDVFEEMEFEVDWDEESKTVTLSNDYYEIMLFTKTSTMLTISSDLSMDYEQLENTIQIVNGRTMLPLREILENVNYTLEWDAETKSTVVTDSNDYTVLDAQKAALEAMMTDADYEYDPTQPSQDLTDEEYAFLENMFATLEEITNAEEEFAGFTNITEMSDESVAAFSALLGTYTSKFSDVECPESLAGMDKNLINFFDELVNDAVVMASVFDDNPELEESGAAFTIALTFMIHIAKDASEAVEPLTNLVKEKNLDLETLFGDKFESTDLSLI